MLATPAGSTTKRAHPSLLPIARCRSSAAQRTIFNRSINVSSRRPLERATVMRLNEQPRQAWPEPDTDTNGRTLRALNAVSPSIMYWICISKG